MTRQPHNRYSMDGFVPAGQSNPHNSQDRSRHVGFDAPRQTAGNSTDQRIRMRRPGQHSLPTPAPQYPPQYQSHQGGQSRQTEPFVARHQTNESRSNFQEFTSYSSAGNLPTPATKQTGRQRRAARKQNEKADRQRGPKRASWLRRTNWKKVFKRTAALVGIFLLLGGGWLGWQFFENSNKVFGGDANILGFLNAKKLRGEDQGQVNILVAGVSTDDPGHSGAALTDSIMVISLDTKNNKAFLLSVPRDLWVDIPGYGHSKINAANAYGDEDNFSQSGYPAGGMGLLAKVINDNFELPIHYHAKVNYSALRDAVNAVGGVTVDIQSSDKRGLYDPNIAEADKGPLKLPNGPQKLDGQTALNLSRARGDPTGDGRIAYGFERSDFTRTEHQRQLVLALKERVSSSSVISNPLKVGQLFDVVGKNLKTDFEPSEIRRLYDINKQIKPADVASVSLNDVNGVNMLASYRSRDGASALIPAAGIDDFSQIQVLLKKLMSTDPVVKESAKIVILNGGDITGLASKESNNLTSKGMNVVAVGDAARQVGANLIIDQSAANGSAKPGTKDRLQKLFGGVAKTPVETQLDLGYPTADFIIVLGTNHKLPPSEAGE